MVTRFWVFSVTWLMTLSLSSHADCAKDLLVSLNKAYMKLHFDKEDQLWSSYMGLKGYKVGAFEKAEQALSDWRSSGKELPGIKAALKDTIAEPLVRQGLEQWKQYFEINTISEPKAQKMIADILKLETDLATEKKKQKLTYKTSKSPETEVTVTKLREIVVNDTDEVARKTAWQGLTKQEELVASRGLIGIVKERRALANALGQSTYYTYRTLMFEGETEEEIFAILDDLELNTRDAAKKWIEKIKKGFGPTATEPWNFSYASRGQLAAKMEPFFPFSEAVRRWGASFQGLGIDYQNGTFIIDLLDRKTKFQNGFIRARKPAYWNVETGKHEPVFANFTSNATFGVGGGLSALRTLLHEGGHGAHFANMTPPSLSASQEEAPSSISGAEVHSMFLDHLMIDPIWLKRYAKKLDGSVMPDDLIEEIILEAQQSLAMQLRSMMVVPYFERELYRMPEKDLTPENIIKLARATEKKFLFMEGSGRPVLTVSHFHSTESSAYYHGYILAELGVWQTRAYLETKFGHITDNVKVGPLLAEKYWKPGNAIRYSPMIKNLTGQEASAQATLDWIKKSPEEVKQYVKKGLEQSAQPQAKRGPIQLNAKVIVKDGDTLISETGLKKNFDQVADEFSSEILRRQKKAP